MKNVKEKLEKLEQEILTLKRKTSHDTGAFDNINNTLSETLSLVDELSKSEEK